MLGRRLLISAILIPALIGLFVLDDRLGPRAPVLLALAMLLAARAAYELGQLLRHGASRPHVPLSAACAAAIVGSGWIHVLGSGSVPGSGWWALGPVTLTFAFCTLLLLMTGIFEYRQPGGNVERLGADFLILGYAGVLTAVTSQLRWIAGAQAGYLVLGSLVIAAKCGDTGAYFAGRAFGRRRMAPRLSPNKTWAGAAGALAGSALGALLWLKLAAPRFGAGWEAPAWYWALLYGAVIGVAGLFGDLAESLIKRDVDRKDSAALFPGMGGLLDVVDSVLFAGPVAYVLWIVLPLRTW